MNAVHGSSSLEEAKQVIQKVFGENPEGTDNNIINHYNSVFFFCVGGEGGDGATENQAES